MKKNPFIPAAALAIVSLAPPFANASPANTELFLEQYCWDCHDDAKPKAGLNLMDLEFDPSNPHNLQEWTRAFDRVSSGEMPPKDEDQPAARDVEAFLQEMGNPLLGAWNQLYKEQGRTIGRRLNPVEYEHTLRDLLQAPWLEIKETLPPDPSVHGFDNVAEGQDVSYIQMAQFLEAAGIAIDRTMLLRPDPKVKTERTWLQEKGRYLSKRVNGKKVKMPRKQMEALPLPEWLDFLGQPNSAQAPRRILYSGGEAGYYKFRVKCRAVHRKGGSITDAEKGHVAWINTTGKRVLGTFDVPHGTEGGIVEFTAWVNDNERFEFYLATIDSPPGKGPASGDAIGLGWFEIEGPFATEECVPNQWPSASYKALFGDLPKEKWTAKSGLREPDRLHLARPGGAKGASPDPYQLPDGMMMVASKDPHKDSARLLRGFMEKAYRRPVEEAEFQRCLSFATQAIDDQFCFQDAMRLAYKAALCSPDFLYFVEEPGKLDDYALASRLSYLLWRSLPDKELIATAKAGKLQSDEGILSQFDRMLADPKSERFVSDFVGQWLNLRAVNDTTPDRDLYPEYFCDTHVVISSVEETEATFQKMLKDNLPISTVVDSDFVMINERLAEVYELEGVRGKEIREVPLPADSPRGGLLTQTSVMKVTANGLSTSPVLRGVWVLDRILGTPPSEPPPAVGSIDPDTRGTTTIREQLAKHSTDPSCASCHMHIDPPGFALESFDVMGAWREKYRATGKGRGPNGEKYFQGPDVDSTGTTVEGDSFKGIHEFREYLLGKEDQLARNLTQRLITFSTGAGVTFADRALIEEILKKTEPSKHGLRSVLKEIVLSDVFRKK